MLVDASSFRALFFAANRKVIIFALFIILQCRYGFHPLKALHLLHLLLRGAVFAVVIDTSEALLRLVIVQSIRLFSVVGWFGSDLCVFRLEVASESLWMTRRHSCFHRTFRLPRVAE